MQQNAPQVNNKKLYVGNLPYSTNQDELQNMFSPFGQVTSATIITDRMSGRSKGFGFVEFANEEDAAKATEALHGSDMGGRPLQVNVARPPQPREDRQGGGGGGGFRPRFNNSRGGNGGGSRGGYGGGRDSYRD